MCSGRRIAPFRAFLPCTVSHIVSDTPTPPRSEDERSAQTMNTPTEVENEPIRSDELPTQPSPVCSGSAELQ